jgi:hypothetical protein
MHQHLESLFLTLEEMAEAGDALVAAERAPAAHDVTDLIARAEQVRGRLAQAHARLRAAGETLPSGPDGARLVARMRSCNERVRAGDLAGQRLLSARATVDTFGHRYATHVIANLPTIAAAPSSARLHGAFAGKPALLVAAGPSLGKNIEGIRRWKGKAVIVAVSHALGALERAGIVPDLVIALDPGDLLRHFGGPSVGAAEALVVSTSCDPRLFDLPARRFITFSGNFGIDSWAYDGLEEPVRVPCGGSVATSAVSLLRQWGCNPIVLTGQDLSFPDGQYYAPGSLDGDARFEVSADGQTGRILTPGGSVLPGAAERQLVRRVPGYHGGEVVTDHGFAMAREWFIATAREHAGELTMLNCTEGGAYLDGMEHVPLEVAAARYLVEAPEFSVGRVLDRVAGSLDLEARRSFVLARVQKMRAAARTCLAHAAECRAVAIKARRRPELGAKLNRAEAALTSCLAGLEFLAAAVQRDLRAAEATARTGPTVNDALEASIRVYDAVTGIMQEALPLLQAAEEKLSVRAVAPSAA